MVKKYVFVRMPEDIFNIYKGIQVKMQGDLKKFTGKDIKVTMPKVFKAVASPDFNENFIQVDIKKLVEVAKKRR